MDAKKKIPEKNENWKISGLAKLNFGLEYIISMCDSS